MNIWLSILKLFRWKTEITVPDRDKAIICVAPHTSNWDFIIGLIAYKSIGRKAGFLMKDFWFFFPLKYLLTALGGVPVKRDSNSSLTNTLVQDFKHRSKLVLAITPEGSRKAVDHWKTGFLRIAYQAQIPVQLGVIDYNKKRVIIKEEFFPSSDIEADLKTVRHYYSQCKLAAKYPEKFKI